MIDFVNIVTLDIVQLLISLILNRKVSKT
jgi:hypothetical protein